MFAGVELLLDKAGLSLLQIRDMLGEPEASTATTSGPTSATATTSGPTSATATQGQASDSCSQLQYLHTACASSPQLINAVTYQAAREILVEYQRDEGFGICDWVRRNSLPSYVISALFRFC